MTSMIYQALLFCPDEKTARVVQQVLSDLEFEVEACAEPFAAVKKLTVQHFDAVVVDCDNEQNATLMFKSARNSSFNQSSLTVAIVDGQLGVAKAFRIGANLVLAKPINVEQSKGTLRVARGLLRKADSAKPSAVSASAAVSAPAAKLAASASLPSTAIDSGFISGLGNKASLEAPQPAVASELTSVELPSMDSPGTDLLRTDSLGTDSPGTDPSTFDPASANPAHFAHDPSAVKRERPLETVGQAANSPKHYPWQPGSKPSAEPMESALRRAAEPAGKSNAAFGGEGQPALEAVTGNADGTSSTAGSAAAARRAKQIELPAVIPSVSEPSLARSPATREEKASKGTLSSVESPRKGATAAGSKAEAKHQAPPSSKGKVLGLVALLLLAAAAYFAWTEMHLSSAPVEGQKPTAALTASPTLANTPTTESSPELPSEDSSKPSAMLSPAVDSQAAQPEAEQPPSPHPSTSGESPGNNSRGSSLPSKVRSATEVPANPAIEVAKPRAATSPAPEPPPSQALNFSSESADKALAGIVSSSSTAALMPAAPGPLRVSEIVSEAMLIKKVAAVYPQPAMLRHLEGSVELEANIDSNGDVSDVKIISGDETLGRAASDAVRQWQYKPYYQNSQAVPIRTPVTLNFKLPD